MATSGQEKVFDKVQNASTSQKLEALHSHAALMDHHLPITAGIGRVGLSEAIGNKSKDAQHLYMQMQDKFHSWKPFINRLQAQDESEVAMVTDGILAYVRANGEIWVKVRNKICQDNLDLAYKYTIEDLHEMKLTAADKQHEILKNAVDLLQRLKVERECLKKEHGLLHDDLMEHKTTLEILLKEKDRQIDKLNTECNLRRDEVNKAHSGMEHIYSKMAKQLDETRGELKLCSEERKKNEERLKEEQELSRQERKKNEERLEEKNEAINILLREIKPKKEEQRERPVTVNVNYPEGPISRRSTPRSHSNRK